MSLSDLAQALELFAVAAPRAECVFHETGWHPMAASRLLPRPPALVVQVLGYTLIEFDSTPAGTNQAVQSLRGGRGNGSFDFRHAPPRLSFAESLHWHARAREKRQTLIIVHGSRVLRVLFWAAAQAAPSPSSCNNCPHRPHATRCGRLQPRGFHSGCF